MGILSDKDIKATFLEHFTKQYGEEAAVELYDNLPDCNYAKAIAEAAYRETLKRMRQTFLKYLTVDSETNDRRRKDYNQAIFDGEKGYAVFNGTDLDMVMEKFDKALKEGE